MRSHQIESWALRIIDQVVAGQPNEDARVELKSHWPDDTDIPKVARQIAGHANAARGDPILWLIGVCQDHGVTGADHAELANWYPRVQKQFDGLAPDLVDINVSTGGVTVVALLFLTERAPFVVKNPMYGTSGGGSVALEVPWRAHTTTRSATRDELLRVLSPRQLLPHMTVLGGTFELTPATGEDKEDECNLRLQLYITPRSAHRVVIPFHRCDASFEIPGCTTLVALSGIRLSPPSSISREGAANFSYTNLSLTVQSTAHEVLIDGPGLVRLQTQIKIPSIEPIASCAGRSVVIRVTLVPVDAEMVLPLQVVMEPHHPNHHPSSKIEKKRQFRWTYKTS